MALTNNSISEKVLLLSKTNWNYKDIQTFFGYGANKALAIKEAARKANGGYPTFDKSLATIDSIFLLSGVKVTEELEKLKTILEIGEIGRYQYGQQE